MKLLVVTNLYHPDRGGGASVFSDMCYGLVQRGHHVTVYAAYPYYPEWRNKSRAQLWRVTKEEINGVTVRRFGMYLPGNPSKFVPRIMYELSFMASLLRSLVYFERFDAVMVYCPVMGAVAYSAVRKLFYWEPTWLNVQDIPADAAAASGISKNWLTRSMGQFAQSLLFNRANVWSTIAPKMIERLTAVRRHDQPIHFVPNFLNGSMADAIASHAPKVGQAPSRPIKLLYAGNIGKKQDLLTFCERLAEAKFDFTFRIHGNGGEAARVAAWVAERGDPRFRFGEFLDERGFVDALFDADLFVITETPGVGASFIPSKLIPGMASGTPVLCVCDAKGPLGQEVREHGLGLVASWPELDPLWRRLDALLRNPQEFSDLQQNCLRRAQAYARGPVVEQVERELENMLHRPRPAAATAST